MQYCNAPATCLEDVGSDNASPSNLESLDPEVHGDLDGFAPLMFVLCSSSVMYLVW